jgi:ubiquinone/menaquinone biosynthesis C-methylase UbiE
VNVTAADLQAVLARASWLTGDDRDFFLRVWATDPEIYRARLAAIGLEGLGNVLDAGCGFGQWSLPLAAANRHVTAVDVSDIRIRALADVAEQLEIGNLTTAVSSIEALPFDDASFDAIFSYSVVYFTDFRKSISEFHRLLRPGGRLYICTNGLGWYLHNLLSGHNASATFDPRAMAIAALENSLSYYATDKHRSGSQIVMPSAVLRETLEQAGFTLDAIVPEGTFAVEGAQPGASFYKGDYHGAEGVYEVVARKAG